MDRSSLELSVERTPVLTSQTVARLPGVSTPPAYGASGWTPFDVILADLTERRFERLIKCVRAGKIDKMIRSVNRDETGAGNGSCDSFR